MTRIAEQACPIKRRIHASLPMTNIFEFSYLGAPRRRMMRRGCSFEPGEAATAVRKMPPAEASS